MAMISSLTHEDPEQLGNYRLIARLGSGGMGTVFLGRSPRGRLVALKTMHPDLATELEFRTRFRLETDAARIIGGHHGAQVFDADPLAETPWLATEYVLGPPLDDAVAVCGPLPENAVRALGIRLCGSLAQLHASDVVHRDLKPSNILLSATGPKVIDFGIARASGDDRLTRAGSAAGTPAFMSPEQATGQEHTPEGDVFALAGVLVFACTGHGPFGTGHAADLLYRVRYSEPDLSEVPAGLVPVLAHCLAKNPEQRPGTPRLAALLRHGSDGGHGPEEHDEYTDSLPDAVYADILRRSTAVWEIQASSPAPPANLSAEEAAVPKNVVRTRRQALTFAGGGIVALAAAGGAWAWARSRENPAKDSAEPASPAAEHMSAPEPRWERDLSSPRVSGLLGAGARVCVMGADGSLFLLSAAGETIAAQKDVWSAVPGGGRLYGLQGSAAQLRTWDADRDGFGDPVADVRDLMGGSGPDSAAILAAHRGTVLIRAEEAHVERRCAALDADTGRTRWRGKIAYDTAALATADRLIVLASSSEQKVWAVEAATGKRVWEKKISLAYGREVSCSGVDRHGNVYLNLDEIHAVRVADGRTMWRFGKGRKHGTDSSGTVEYGAPVSVGGTVYSLESGNGVVALDVRSGQLRWEIKTQVASRISPDAVPVVGNRYVYFPSDGPAPVTAMDCNERKVSWTLAGKGGEATPSLLAHRRSRQLVVALGGRVLGLPLN
ncbi:protein kinase domain-containing protein [Streptomyces sp. AA1529]|uniref:protein kinase domain-containing protein n=1 Tax=Streptomyces sp. AA1529 TaxID=1203257 RepID=UPI003D7474E6